MKQLEIPSQAPATGVETSITAITAYVNQALITRQGLVTLTGQERELVIPGLPPALQPESVQISGIGTVAVQLLGVRLERVTPDAVSPDQADLQAQLQQWQAQLRSIQNRLRSLHLQQTFIQNLSEKSVDQFSQGLAQKQIDLESTRQLLHFLGEQYDEYARVITQTEQQQQGLEQQIQAWHQQNQSAETPAQDSHTLFVTVEPTGAGEFVLEISYLVDQASWTPLYELTFDATGDQVHLNYVAEVQQRTGEDWTGASLTLSTSELGLGMSLPTLHPWYLEVVPPTASQPELRPSQPEFDNPPGMISRQRTATKVARESGITTLILDQDNGIASNGKFHKVNIFSGDYPCRIEYIAAPRLVNFAYLQATITHRSQSITLLAGKANLFRNQLFIGTTQLEKVAPGQTFQLNLGIDEGLRIERHLVEHQSRERFLTHQRRATYAYRLTITNLRSYPIPLRLIEQLPISRHKQVRVRLNRTYPRIWLQEPHRLEWTLTLPAGATRELYYQFSVEHPRELILLGLDSGHQA